MKRSFTGIFALLASLHVLPSAVHSGDTAFHAHWSQGKAELTSYDLQQSRYGEVHPGHAVLVFVTEDFSRAKQVKLDAPSRAGEDRVPVLKLNATKKFNTGVYPYSVMTSVFTAVDGSGCLKMSHSMQEWCGHVFAQLNRTRDGWRGQQRSYFESEGDEDFELGEVLLEDELWTRLRLDPASLPTGELEILPSAEHLRLRHRPWRPLKARAELTAGDGDHGSYEVTYANGRTLTIDFAKAYPHAILGWQESEGGLSTRATRRKVLMLDYWSRNRLEDAALRKKLGLP